MKWRGEKKEKKRKEELGGCSNPNNPHQAVRTILIRSMCSVYSTATVAEQRL